MGVSLFSLKKKILAKKKTKSKSARDTEEFLICSLHRRGFAVGSSCWNCSISFQFLLFTHTKKKQQKEKPKKKTAMRRVVEFIFGRRWRGTNFQHFCPFFKKKIRPDRMTSESLFGHFFFGGGLERVWNVPFFLNGLDRVKNSVKTKKKTRYDRHGTGFHGNQCHDPLPFSVAPFSFCCPISFSSFFLPIFL